MATPQTPVAEDMTEVNCNASLSFSRPTNQIVENPDLENGIKTEMDDDGYESPASPGEGPLKIVVINEEGEEEEVEWGTDREEEEVECGTERSHNDSSTKSMPRSPNISPLNISIALSGL